LCNSLGGNVGEFASKNGMEGVRVIPKKIHYCWFGRGTLPPLAVRCLESWKKFLPEYELCRWDEDSFDILQNQYVAEAYAHKKYAFVSDYVRLWALKKFGGIYMDTDVEVLKNLDDFLAFPAFTGFESATSPVTGIIGSERGGAWVSALLKDYEKRHFVRADGSLDLTTNTQTISDYTVRVLGVRPDGSRQVVPRVVAVFPVDYFCPNDPATGRTRLTKNSVCIHHFSSSWQPRSVQILSKTKKNLMRVISPKIVNCAVSALRLRELKKWLGERK